ncbi:MAG: NADH-quinone oxidoreductase subunit NuoK [Actinomycetia bacterium]|nr:NADH-quinone oxidoreductase subunit NuoK [Actinomycetes bacterium]
MTVVQFVLVGMAFFSIGLYGVLSRKNAVLILASVELMLAGVNINMVTFDTYLQDQLHAGQIFSLFIIALAAAEVGIGIAIILLIFRNLQTADVDSLDLMKD